ncbi:Thiol-disulfide isomerase or thioredoxin [Salinimicrobium sediminis]|uniref:Thiol-disulfide isomerase or thioredoxin n=1 Tax=Salinimicrobium sediminis TaxID=1343891 RepID=A0A285X5S7_9FLAO|nr:TlpA disulfide reductase family protein [Salinimicrobium sediminis]SOC80366.1 Thiol-disulfide isomerase or thioredoxin [Salinimicrobium sediminis]
MIRKILLVALIALLGACEDSSNNGYYISGTVNNATEGQQIIVSELNDTNTQAIPIDTAVVKDGKFELDLPEKDNPTISFLNLEGTRGNILFIADNTPISFEVYPDSLFASEVTGGKDNEVLYTYLKDVRNSNSRMTETRNSMRAAFQAQDTATLKTLEDNQKESFEMDKNNRKELIKNNPGSIVSIMILQDMLNTKAYSSSEMKSLYEQLDPEVQQTSLAQTFKSSLDRMSKTDIGSPAPNFSAPTPEGKELALKDALGKVTLVDFWAAWCRPCRMENPNIVKVYNEYHDKGFNIIQVSLDRPGQKDKWVQAIEEDNLGQWNHVSNLMFWQDPIAAEYGIRAIPAAFLLDEDGKIIAKDLRGPALGQKVGELLD